MLPTSLTMIAVLLLSARLASAQSSPPTTTQPSPCPAAIDTFTVELVHATTAAAHCMQESPEKEPCVESETEIATLRTSLADLCQKYRMTRGQCGCPTLPPRRGKPPGR